MKRRRGRRRGWPGKRAFVPAGFGDQPGSSQAAATCRASGRPGPAGLGQPVSPVLVREVAGAASQCRLGRRKPRRGEPSSSLAMAGSSRRFTEDAIPCPHTGFPVIRGTAVARRLASAARVGSGPGTRRGRRLQGAEAGAGAVHDARRHARHGWPTRARGPPAGPPNNMTESSRPVRRPSTS